MFHNRNVTVPGRSQLRDRLDRCIAALRAVIAVRSPYISHLLANAQAHFHAHHLLLVVLGHGCVDSVDVWVSGRRIAAVRITILLDILFHESDMVVEPRIVLPIACRGYDR